MKTLILTIAILTLSLKSMCQVSTNDYKDYNPCTTCITSDDSNKSGFKQSVKTEVSREVVGKSKSYTNRIKTNIVRTTQAIVISTLTVATSLVINKVK